MASITIRKLDDELKQRLRVRSAEHGRSMEEEAREILRLALHRASPSGLDLGSVLRKRFERFEGVELGIERRQPLPEPPNLDE